MFRCDLCGSVVPASTPCNRIPIETREVDYPRRERAHWRPPQPPATKGKFVDDPGGHGTAIVREVNACPDCTATRPP
jgi:hypothetical protein